jgi:hypothetical protein
MDIYFQMTAATLKVTRIAFNKVQTTTVPNFCYIPDSFYFSSITTCNTVNNAEHCMYGEDVEDKAIFKKLSWSCPFDLSVEQKEADGLYQIKLILSL